MLLGVIGFELEVVGGYYVGVVCEVGLVGRNCVVVGLCGGVSVY